VFERDLAGRFPFHKLEAGTKLEDASPEATFRFLQEAADFTRRYRGVLADRKDPSARDVVRFLDRLEKVRVFLAPLWSQADAATDGFYEVKVDFRANQAREVGGNQIAAWSMKIAEERLSLGGPKSVSRWRLGEPVRLSMRWAKNGPDVPTEGANPNMTVKEREVTFEDRGSWALLRTIAGHQVSNLDAAEGADVSGHVLLFVVRTIPDPSGGFVDRVGADAGVVRVFVRLGLTAGEKDKAFKYPYFPEIAPALN
jgi:type VI secretion system protein ImpL